MLWNCRSAIVEPQNLPLAAVYRNYDWNISTVRVQATTIENPQALTFMSPLQARSFRQCRTYHTGRLRWKTSQESSVSSETRSTVSCESMDSSTRHRSPLLNCQRSLSRVFPGSI